MRIIFIHGFGENETIFKNIAPSLPGEQVFINLWEQSGKEKKLRLNVFDFAKKLVTDYHINEADWIIGHSLGGWIAYYIKHHSNCRIIQISSFTNFDRVVSPIRSGNIIYWLINNRIYLNAFQKWIEVKKYKGLPSKDIFIETFDRLLQGDRQAAINQLQLIFEPVQKIAVEPELRIHALKDPIIKPPLTSFYTVPGDHFSVYTHPGDVIKPILALLQEVSM